MSKKERPLIIRNLDQFAAADKEGILPDDLAFLKPDEMPQYVAITAEDIVGQLGISLTVSVGRENVYRDGGSATKTVEIRHGDCLVTEFSILTQFGDAIHDNDVDEVGILFINRAAIEAQIRDNINL